MAWLSLPDGEALYAQSVRLADLHMVADQLVRESRVVRAQSAALRERARAAADRRRAPT
jgi:hypothetical protein